MRGAKLDPSRRRAGLEQERRPLGRRVDDVPAVQLKVLAVVPDGLDAVEVGINIVFSVFFQGVVGPTTFPKSDDRREKG